MYRNDNGIDKIINKIDEVGNKNYQYVRVYNKPGKVKSAIGFVAALIFFIIMIGLFSWNVMYFVMLIGSVLIMLFFGINLFTKKGFGIPKTVRYEIKPEEEIVEEDYPEEEEEVPVDEDEEEEVRKPYEYNYYDDDERQ